MLEQIVRPFETPLSIAITRVWVQPVTAPTGTASITWGKSGTIPVPVSVVYTDPASGIAFKVLTPPGMFVEKARASVLTKVHNPANPAQFVNVRRTTATSLVKVKDPAAAAAVSTVYVPSGGADPAASVPGAPPTTTTAPGADAAVTDPSFAFFYALPIADNEVVQFPGESWTPIDGAPAQASLGNPPAPDPNA